MEDGWKRLAATEIPPFGVKELLIVAARSSGVILEAIRASDFSEHKLVTSFESLNRVFRCGPHTHAFEAPPHSWTSFREPQFTAGLAHFLQVGSFHRRSERVRQFLTAALQCAGNEPLAERLASAEIVETNAVAEEARVDLIVEATTANHGKIGVIIEAKFGHHLTRGQLPKARRYSALRGLNDDNAAFLVVLPHPSNIGTAVFSKAGNSRWQAVSWWALLLNLEGQLTGCIDDDAFRAFRHTLWWQTYG